MKSFRDPLRCVEFGQVRADFVLVHPRTSDGNIHTNFDTQLLLGKICLDGEQTLHGNNLDEFIELFGQRAKGKPAALGFEAPLFIPLRGQLENLTKQRDGEHGKPWSAGAGATVTTIGLAIMSYTFSQLHNLLPDKTVTLDWKDALNAARGFNEALGNLDAANTVQCDCTLSLVGACLMRAGWIEPNHSVLDQKCLVIRPD